MLRRLFAVTLIALLSILFISGSGSTRYATQAVITIPELQSDKVKDILEKEFRSLRSVQQCDISLITRTMVLHFDDEKLTKNDIERYCNKWGCYPTAITFDKLINFPTEE